MLWTEIGYKIWYQTNMIQQFYFTMMSLIPKVSLTYEPHERVVIGHLNQMEAQMTVFARVYWQYNNKPKIVCISCERVKNRMLSRKPKIWQFNSLSCGQNRVYLILRLDQPDYNNLVKLIGYLLYFMILQLDNTTNQSQTNQDFLFFFLIRKYLCDSRSHA